MLDSPYMPRGFPTLRSLQYALYVAAAGALTCGPAGAAVSQTFSFTVARAPHALPLDPALADPAWAAGKVPDGNGPWENVTTRSPAQLRDDRLFALRRQESVRRLQGRSGRRADRRVADDQRRGLRERRFRRNRPRHERRGVKPITSKRRRAASATNRPTKTCVSARDGAPPATSHERRVERRHDYPARRAARAARRQANLALTVRPRDRRARRTSLVGVGSDHAGRAERHVADPSARYRAFGPAAELDLAASAAARPKPRADIYGLASIGEDRNLFQQANGTFLPMNVRAFGGDVSYPLTPTIRFVGTLNPDFSNVEIDQQTIVPQEFQRQLVEYRPFFSQGAAYINADSGVRAPAGTNVHGAVSRLLLAIRRTVRQRR